MKANFTFRMIGQVCFYLLVLTFISCTVKVDMDNEDLIPRKELFSNPERSSPQLSPDGKLLAYMASDNLG